MDRKVKPIWILLEQETVGGSGISWAICKSAPHSRQITMPAPHHSVFYRPDALPAAEPTVSKHWRHSRYTIYTKTCSPSGATWAHRVTLISTSVALSQTPAYTARPWYGTSVSSGVTVYGRAITQCGSVAEWLACWTQAQKGPGSNLSRDAVG